MNINTPDFLTAVAEEVLPGNRNAGSDFAASVQPVAVPYRGGHGDRPGQSVDDEQISRRRKSNRSLALPQLRSVLSRKRTQPVPRQTHHHIITGDHRRRVVIKEHTFRWKRCAPQIVAGLRADAVEALMIQKEHTIITGGQG